MSILCIILGLLSLVGMTGAGYFLAHIIITGSPLFMSMLQLTPESVYVVMVGLCFVIGLLICLNLVMLGVIYRKVSFSAAWCDRHSKRHHLSRHAKDMIPDDEDM